MRIHDARVKRVLLFPALLIACVFSAVAEPAKSPKNVILMIGDGMGLAQLQSGAVAKKAPLELEKFRSIGFAKTHSADNFVTDSAAAGTALATGHKTNNGMIGQDPSGKAVNSLLTLARNKGLATGLVVTKDITDATPAAFVAHQPSRKMAEEIAADLVESGVDVFVGGGRKRFDKREDGRDLIRELKQKNYKVVSGTDEIEKITSGKVAGFVSTERWHGRETDQLKRTTVAALRILEKNPKGFFLMVEGSQIDSAGHDNKIEDVMGEMMDFDKAIGAALAFAEKNPDTLIVVTADHETGGLTLRDGSLKEGTIHARFSTGGHTGVMVPVFAYGPGAEEFAGIYENTDIFQKVKRLLHLAD